MLAAVAIAAAAGVVALVAVTAVSARQKVVADDAAARAATMAARRGIDEAAAQLRRRPEVGAGGTLIGVDGDSTWRVSWTAGETAPNADAWPAVNVGAIGRLGPTRTTLSSVLELRRAPWAAGVVCAADVELTAPMTVAGSGAYVGGCLRGREHIMFEWAPGATPVAGEDPVDGVHGDRYAIAAVHAGGSIWAAGVEIHEAGASVLWPGDSDADTPGALVDDLVAAPPAESLAALGEEAAVPADAGLTTAGDIDLAALSLRLPAAAGGRLVLVREAGDEVVVSGVMSESADPLVVVVEGDAVLGRLGSATTLRGALVVLGTLEVRGSCGVEGSLYARSLIVKAALDVAVTADWRRRPLTWVTAPVVTALGRS